MSESSPSFFARLSTAFAAFFRVLGDAALAADVRALLDAGGRAPVRHTSSESALQLLALLQREGRLVDFLEEEVASFSDAEIGAAARVVHQGCRKALREHMNLAPVRAEEEGSALTVPAGFNAAELRLTGNVAGQAPYRGVLRHRGWRAASVRLPQVTEGHDLTILAPAEVEL